VLVDPTDPGALASAMAELLGDPERREQLIGRGRERAATFTWEATARRTWAVYEELA
jgi:glycosyltransferase involved in cell wall biosynthesis